MSRFSGSSIIITGAASGIGQETARHLATEGADLTLVDVNDQGLEDTRALILDAVPDARTVLVTADVTKEEDVSSYVQAALDTCGRIDGFFNNAGIAAPESEAAEYPTELFDRLININATGAFLGLRAVARVMRDQGSGVIVNTASVAGVSGAGKQLGYAASKHAVVGMTRSAALDYAAQGIRINAVAPGGVLTPMGEQALKEAGGDGWQALADSMAQANPMKRLGQPEDVAPVVAFLLSEESGFMTGQTLTVDGGQTVGN